MVEPPVIGFTGVVWPARPTEQLSRDLTTGPGAAPMAEASVAWTHLAAAFGAAVAEYEHIVATLRESWRSPESEPALERITQLRDWLVEAAAAAGQNAVRAGNQAAAYEVARLAMPHIAEIAALEELKQGIEQAGAALGSPLVAAAAEIEGEQDIAKASAARVMQSYESATTPLADPWQHKQPPVIATSAALEAEQAAAEQSTSKQMRPGTPSFSLPGSVVAGAVPRVPGAFRAPTVVHSVPEASVLPGQSSAVHTEPGGRSTIPGASVAPAAASTDAHSTSRAGAVSTRPGREFDVEAGVDAAPPVVGGVVEAPSRAAAPEQTS
ncbi:PPE domain-containing protein [Nocardia donostiensis]|uniref:PPE domain-containing protein n=1 Tax=Nocardia donostiensis TaxID=1538463 RepID=A0A1W0BEA4_9NOCA|nr:PPE domain-containing protein [Nocardia donostiensis]ONM50534.1 hypothetical protein B0T46_01065 [Nocardia donostiensis]OQS17232.1 hypothetical protein B0T36_01100 [Nocardia donostiensis]OQS20820.1 hypothetical protein B0T44_09395 [Nocardia donostiensis]